MNKRKKVLIIFCSIVALLVVAFFIITRNGLIKPKELKLLVFNIEQSEIKDLKENFANEVVDDSRIIWEYNYDELSNNAEDYSSVYVSFYLKNWTFLDNEVYAINVIPKEETKAIIIDYHEGPIERFTTDEVFVVIDMQIPYADDEKIIEEVAKFDFELYVKNSLCNTRKYTLSYDKDDIVIEEKRIFPEE